MDTGATHHLTSDLDNLTIHSDFQGCDEVKIGNGNTLSIAHVGSSNFSSHGHLFHLYNIYHVPNICANLLSMSSFTQSNNVSIEFFPFHFEINNIHMKEVLISGSNDKGLYSFFLDQISLP